MIDSKWLVLAVVSLALVFRLATGAFLGFNAPPDRAACGADTEEFELGAWNMAQGNGFVLWEDGNPSAFRAPGYPLMLAGLYRLFGRQYWVNRLVLSVIGALTCLLVYRLALAVRLRPRVALCAMLVAALHPLQAYFCGHFMSEVPSAFLNVLATLFLVKGVGSETWDVRREMLDVGGETWDVRREMLDVGGETLDVGGGTLDVPHSTFHVSRLTFHVPRLSLVAFAGVVNGLSVLVRPAAIFLVPVLGGLLLLLHWRRPIRAIVMAVLFGLGTLLVVAPWTYRNYRVFDRSCLVASNGGSTLWGANNTVTATVGSEHWGGWISTGFDMATKQREVLSLANEVDRDRREWELGVEFLKQNPRTIPGLLVGKIWRAVSPFPQSPNRVFVLITASSQIVMLALCGIGLLGRWGAGKTADCRLQTTDRRLKTGDGRRKTEGGRLHLPLLAQFLTLVATVLVFYGSERFRVPYEPIFAVYGGMGLWALLEVIGGRSRHRAQS